MEAVDSCPATPNGIPFQLFLLLISNLMSQKCSLTPPLMDDHGPQLKAGDEFDFIVVGAGSAGSVVANRISEIPNLKVLVLEAGSDQSSTSMVPALFLNLQGTDEDWQYKVQPQDKACQSIKDKQCKWPAGKALGGSSTINAMIYIRGNSRDYDTWESMGCPGWDYNTVLQYFKKSEANLEFGDRKKYHGKCGYQKISFFNYQHIAKRAICEAASELGIPSLEDMANGKYIGFGDAQGFVSEGTRYNTYRAFLNSVKQRPNLFLAKNTYVTQVLIDPNTKTAIGVNVNIGHQIIPIYAKKQVVLSAGAIRTPQLLMLSGIGPANHLNQFNIPVIQNLPVGMNLQDHMIYAGAFVALRAVEAGKGGGPNALQDQIYQYFSSKQGLLSTIGITDFVGFIDSKDYKLEFPDIQFHHIYHNKGDPTNLKTLLNDFGVEDYILNNLIKVNAETDLLQIAVTLINPKSRGTVKLNSANVFEYPILNPNYLDNYEDVNTITRGVNFVKRLLKTRVFRRLKAELINLNITNCDRYTFLSDQHSECSARNFATTVYHYAGTAKMGSASDPTTVVDPRLRVHGINNLRVADASIMPNVISGNTNAPTIMIGEKASDMMKEDLGYRQIGSKVDIPPYDC